MQAPGQSRRRFELSGHRGARALWPENTLTGFAGALRIGVDALELDVVLTADGVPVVTHDLILSPELTREADGPWLVPPGPPVRSLELARLRRFDIGRARPGSSTALAHPAQSSVDGEAVPTLAQVLTLAGPHRRVALQVELKTDPNRPDISPDPAELAERVVAAATEAGVLDRLALRSFDWRGLRHIAARWPLIALCYLTEQTGAEALATVYDAAAGHAADWAPDFATLTHPLVQEAQSHGLAVKPYTVNRPEDMARLIGWGVDGFCTDDPGLARAVLAEAGLAPPISGEALWRRRGHGL